MDLKYVIRFVTDMGQAADFYQNVLALSLRFQSPYWTEFDTGTTTLALHPATADHPAGTTQLGFNTEDLEQLYDDRRSAGIEFSSPPRAEHGVYLASFLDRDGAENRISGKIPDARP